jgi:hypothetical protein
MLFFWGVLAVICLPNSTGFEVGTPFGHSLTVHRFFPVNFEWLTMNLSCRNMFMMQKKITARTSSLDHCSSQVALFI